MNDNSKKKLATLILIIGLIIVFGKACSKGKGGIDITNNNIKKTPTDAEAFFINNDKGYALFRTSGEKVSDFIFSRKSSFIGGYALTKKDNKDVVINEYGKITLSNKEYDTIKQCGPFYIVSKDSKEELVTGRGFLIYSLKDAIVVYKSNYVVVLKDIERKTIIVVNYRGNVLDRISYTGEGSTEINRIEKVMTITINSKETYAYDLVEEKKITKFEGRYRIDSKFENESYLFSKTTDTKESKRFKLYNNKKLINLPSTCDTVNLLRDRYTCKISEDTYLIEDNGEVSTKLVNGTYFYDKDNYIVSDYETTKFYSDGKLVKELPVKNQVFALTHTFENIYPLKDNETNLISFYNSKGEKLFDKSFVQAEDFNAGSTALVQEEGTKTQYLINKNGEKASADYEEITPYGYSSSTNLEYYVVKKDGKYGLINLIGKELIIPKSTEIALYKKDNKFYAIVLLENGSKEIYDLSTGKVLITSTEGNITMHNKYIADKTTKGTIYYLYTGKTIYEDK